MKRVIIVLVLLLFGFSLLVLGLYSGFNKSEKKFQEIWKSINWEVKMEERYGLARNR